MVGYKVKVQLFVFEGLAGLRGTVGYQVGKPIQGMPGLSRRDGKNNH